MGSGCPAERSKARRIDPLAGAGATFPVDALHPTRSVAAKTRAARIRPATVTRGVRARGRRQALSAVSSPALPVGALPKLVIVTPMPLASVVSSWLLGASLSLAVPVPAVSLMYWPCLK